RIRRRSSRCAGTRSTARAPSRRCSAWDAPAASASSAPRPRSSSARPSPRATRMSTGTSAISSWVVCPIASRATGGCRCRAAAAAMYESWLVHMCERTFRDKLGQSLYEQYLTDGRPTFALYDLIGSPSSTWFADLASGDAGDRDAIAGAALEDAVRDLVKRLG